MPKRTSVPSGFRSARPALAAALLLLLLACGGQQPEEMVDLGRKLAIERKHAEAVVHYKAALQKRPDWPEARLLLARSLLASGQREAAEAELARLLLVESALDEALPLFLETLLVGGEAKRIVTLHAAHRPRRPEAVAEYKALLASAWLAVGQRGKAEQSLTEALAAKPDDVRAGVLMARILAGNGKIDEAAASVARLLQSQPNAKEAWALNGDLLLAGSKPDVAEARKAYQRALELDGSYVPAHASLVQLAVRVGDLGFAKSQVTAMRAAAPGHPLTTLTEAQVAFVDNQLEESRTKALALLSVFPDLPSALHLAGMLEMRGGSVSQASRHFRKALNIDAGMTVTREALAEAELRLGQPDRALATLEPLLAAEQSQGRALALAADARLQMGDAAGAEALYLRAARAQPNELRHQAAAAMARIERGGWADAVVELESIAGRTSATYADEALFAARLRRGEFDQALQLVEAMEKKQPARQARWLELRGSVELRKRDFTKARATFEAASKARPESYVAVGNLVELDVLQGAPDSAQKRLEEYIARQPQHPAALLALAMLTSKQPTAQPDQVRAKFDAAIRAAPSEPAPRLRLVEYLLRRSLFKDALSSAQDALAAIPDDPRVLDAVGRAQGRSGDVEQASKTFRRMAALLPNSPDPYIRLAELYRAGGQSDQAVTAYRRALDVAPASYEAQRGLITTMLQSAKPADVLAQVNRMKSARPNSPTGYSLESLVHMHRRDTEAAVKALRTGFERTGSRELGSRLVSQLLAGGKLPDAEGVLAAWLRRLPNDPEAIYLQSAASLLKGDLALAERQLRQLVSVAPQHAPGLNNLAAILAEQRKPEAVSLARRALEQEPDNPAYLDTLASALAGDQKMPEALVVHARALELAPEDPNLRFTKAKLALQSNDKATARSEIQRLEGLGAAFPRRTELAELKAKL